MSAPYHAAVLVADLDEDIGNFEALLGIAFREPDERALRPFDSGDPGLAPVGPVRFAFSVGGFPHVELIEAQDGGLFDAAAGLGVHHVGAWREEMDRVREEQEEAGLPTAGRFADPDGVERVFYAGARPLMVESVNARLRRDYEIWLAAGAPRPTASPARGATYHLAYLVASLKAAMPLYERILGIAFRPPMKRPMITGVGPDMDDPSGPRIEVEFTYSLGDRAPYVELMQIRDDDSVFGRAQGEGFHHVGIWSPDPAAARAAQLAAGAEIEGRYFSEDGIERVCFAGLGGVRGEFVNEAIRPQTEEWLPQGSHRV